MNIFKNMEVIEYSNETGGLDKPYQTPVIFLAGYHAAMYWSIVWTFQEEVRIRNK